MAHNSFGLGAIPIPMAKRMRWMTAVLGAALMVAPGYGIALAQSDSGTSAKQDMKQAGRDTKAGAKDAGRGVKKGTKGAWHSTKKGSKKAWKKTKNTTKGAARGAKQGAQQPQ
ncbi:MAG: hypothetical protein ACLGXA_11875 [Acidobacteriota bacterium]